MCWKSSEKLPFPQSVLKVFLPQANHSVDVKAGAPKQLSLHIEEPSYKKRNIKIQMEVLGSSWYCAGTSFGPLQCCSSFWWWKESGIWARYQTF